MNILATCVAHLRDAGPRRWDAIGAEINVPPTTLRKIAYHDAPNPAVLTCQAILDYFEAIKRRQRKLPPPAPRATRKDGTPEA